jgi:hypothetical protein
MDSKLDYPTVGALNCFVGRSGDSHPDGVVTRVWAPNRRQNTLPLQWVVSELDHTGTGFNICILEQFDNFSYCAFALRMRQSHLFAPSHHVDLPPKDYSVPGKA